MNTTQTFIDVYRPDAQHSMPIGTRTGELVLLRGIEPASRETSDDAAAIERQTGEVIEALRALLDSQGGSLDNLGRVTGYMRSPGTQRDPVYNVWERVFADANDKPAFKVLSADLPAGVLLRLDCVAVLGQRRRRFDIPNVDARDPTVRIGSYVFTSRLHGTSPETSKTVDGLEAQARQALANGVRLVELAGGSASQMTQITAFGRDLRYVPVLREVIEQQFNGRAPVLHPLVTFIRDELEVMVEITAVL